MSSKKWVLGFFVGILYLTLHGASSQTVRDPSNASEAGVNSKQLGRIYSVLKRHVEHGELPGAVVLIARDGKIAGLEAIGYADLETKRPMRSDSIFRLASATKIITSVAALILYEEGKFGLRDPVSEYLPEFKNLRVYGDSNKVESVKRTMTIRDLLRHTSGYSYGYQEPQQSSYRDAGILRPGPDLDWSHDWTLDQWVARLATIPLAEEPGTRFNYGFSSDILGLLIERVSGQPLDRFMQEKIFRPLEMDSTGFFLPPDRLSLLTSIYSMQDGKTIPLDRAEDSPFRKRPNAFSAGGGWDSLGNKGLLSSAPDMFQFLQMLINGGELEGVRILGRKTVELMFQNHLTGLASPDSLTPGVGFGFGYAVLYDSSKYGEIGSPGTIWWAGSTNAFYWIDPREKLIGILMLQVRPFPYRNLMDVVQHLSFTALE